MEYRGINTKRISKEEYSKEVELLANRCRELKKRIRELDILDCHSPNSLEESRTFKGV